MRRSQENSASALLHAICTAYRSDGNTKAQKKAFADARAFPAKQATKTCGACGGTHPVGCCSRDGHG